MPKIALFYFSRLPLSNTTGVRCGDRMVYIRVQEAIAEDVCDALDEADPREDEYFLNSHLVQS